MWAVFHHWRHISVLDADSVWDSKWVRPWVPVWHSLRQANLIILDHFMIVLIPLDSYNLSVTWMIQIESMNEIEWVESWQTVTGSDSTTRYYYVLRTLCPAHIMRNVTWMLIIQWMGLADSGDQLHIQTKSNARKVNHIYDVEPAAQHHFPNKLKMAVVKKVLVFVRQKRNDLSWRTRGLIVMGCSAGTLWVHSERVKVDPKFKKPRAECRYGKKVLSLLKIHDKSL